MTVALREQDKNDAMRAEGADEFETFLKIKQ